jgi:hypothetical protein
MSQWHQLQPEDVLRRLASDAGGLSELSLAAHRPHRPFCTLVWDFIKNTAPSLRSDAQRKMAAAGATDGAEVPLGDRRNMSAGTAFTQGRGPGGGCRHRQTHRVWQNRPTA